MQSPTHSNTEKANKNTKLKAVIYIQKTYSKKREKEIYIIYIENIRFKKDSPEMKL